MINCTFENGDIASPGLRHMTVGTIVVKNDHILLALRQNVSGIVMLEVGKWTLPGGYLDRDERLINAAEREVLEETGWKITNLRLFRINDNPNRPHEDRQNLSAIFIADAVEQMNHLDRETAEIKWFPLDALPKVEQIAFDHSEDLELYKKYLKSSHSLPILG